MELKQTLAFQHRKPSVDDVLVTQTRQEAIDRFAELRQVSTVGLIDEGATRFAFTSITGRREEFDTKYAGKCTELIDFVKGYHSVEVSSPSASYLQGQRAGGIK